MIVKRKLFGRKKKYPKDWDEEDENYLNEIKKQENKNLIRDISLTTLGAMSPSLIETLRNDKPKLHVKTGLIVGSTLGGLSYYVRKNTIKDRQNSYRKLDTKEKRQERIMEDNLKKNPIIKRKLI